MDSKNPHINNELNEKALWHINGYYALILLLAISFVLFSFLNKTRLLYLLIPFLMIAISGFTIIPPNYAKVYTFLGNYCGSIKKSGFYFTFPFIIAESISLKVANFNSGNLKVNDLMGNPIEIGAVISYRINDTAKAKFGVDYYEQYIKIQSESSIRHIAALFPYDTDEENQYSLRANPNEIANTLKNELQEKLQEAGAEIMDSRITHLAYSAEIANAMLQRQQAAAILSARKYIVQGAVGIVTDAIRQLESNSILVLNERDKAQIVTNLLVSLVSEHPVTPTVNVGNSKE